MDISYYYILQFYIKLKFSWRGKFYDSIENVQYTSINVRLWHQALTSNGMWLNLIGIGYGAEIKYHG